MVKVHSVINNLAVQLSRVENYTGDANNFNQSTIYPSLKIAYVTTDAAHVPFAGQLVSLKSSSWMETQKLEARGHFAVRGWNGTNWSDWAEYMTKADLNSIFPLKYYSTSSGTYISIDSIVTPQIAIIRIENDGSVKTPTGKDGILIAFGDDSSCVQLFFDWSDNFKRRIRWGGSWKNWI